MATRYISPTGNNANAGTTGSPWRTLQYGADQVFAGDTLILKDGTYPSEGVVTGGDGDGNNYSVAILHNSGTRLQPITIRAENRHAAILDAENLADSYINLLNVSYVTLKDLVIKRGYKDGIHSNDRAHHIKILGNRIEFIANRSTATGLGLDGLYTNPNCHDFVIDGNLWRDIGRTDANWLDHALYLHGYNYQITNNIFFNQPKGWHIQTADGLSNVLIANNTFAFPCGNTQDGHLMLWDRHSNIIIRNNIFYLPTGYALTRYTSVITAGIVDRNIVYSVGSMMADSSGFVLSNNQLGVNPSLVNAGAYNFHLNSGSPARDAARVEPCAPLDYDGVVRGATPDIGAFQYV